jgi:hypothetical protein
LADDTKALKKNMEDTAAATAAKKLKERKKA